MRDAEHTFPVERIIEEVRAEHRAKFKRPLKYLGLRSNQSRRHKYDGCGFVGTVRMLSVMEIEQLQAHVDRCRESVCE